MKIININGPVNSGKSTISKLLAQQLPNNLFIEVDDFDAHGKEFPESIGERLNQLYEVLDEQIMKGKLDFVIFAYPMYLPTFDEITKLTTNRAEFLVITLCPSLESCLTNRGNRELDDWEYKRIPEMYAEGVPMFEKSDYFIDNSGITAEETTAHIVDFLKTKMLEKKMKEI